MDSDAAKRRAARASWTTKVSHNAAEADQMDVEFWLKLSAEERIDLVARLSLEAYRRSVGDPNAQLPKMQRSVVRISRP